MNNSTAANNTPLSMMEVYHLMRAFLDGNVESEETLDEMIAGVDELAPMISDDVMCKIRNFIDTLSEPHMMRIFLLNAIHRNAATSRRMRVAWCLKWILLHKRSSSFIATWQSLMNTE